MNDKQKQSVIVLEFISHLTKLLENDKISLDKYKLLIIKAKKSIEETDFSDKVQKKLNDLTREEGLNFSV